MSLISSVWVSVGYSAPTDDLDIQLPDDLDALLSEEQAVPYSYGGYVKNETAYRFDEPRSFTKIKNILFLDGQYEFGKSAKFFSSGWVYYDLAYDFFKFETIAAREVRDEDEPLVFVEQLSDDRDDAGVEIREFYFDFYLKNLDIRIGKQHIIWGVLEGIRVVDEINPMDFRELILPEFLDYRIPLWSLKLDYYRNLETYELIWIPDLKFHQPAPAGSEWEFFQILDTTSKPESFTPKFSEIGFKMTRPLGGAEISLSYFFTWDDYPSTFRAISASEIEFNEPDTPLAILPTYSRLSMYGATITKEVKGDILKGEIAYVSGKYFAIDDVFDDEGFLLNDGEFKRDHVRWGIGYDFSLWGADFSPAITQWIILKYAEEILTDKYDTSLNLFIRKPLQRSSAVFTFLMIRLINFQETYMKPKVVFNLTDRFQVATGMDLFIGERAQFGRAASEEDPGGLVDLGQRARFLGNFRDNRRIFLEFKYNF